jgi:hypothetical protein
MPRLIVIALIGVALAATGCGRSKAKITGTVTLEGLPVTSGTVTYFTPGGEPIGVPIGPDGKYEVDGLIPGECVVTVFQLREGAAANPGASGGDKKKKKRDDPTAGADADPNALPPIYGDSATSPLKFPVKRGRQIIDLPLVKQ